MSRLHRLCGCCEQYQLISQWDDLYGSCAACAHCNSLGFCGEVAPTCCHDCIDRPDVEWMRRDRSPPDLTKFTKLGMVLDLERSQRAG